MKRKSKLGNLYIRWRFIVVIISIALVFSALVGRVAYIQVVNAKQLISQGDKRSVRVETTREQRGMITDRHGSELAISVPVQAIWADPLRIQQYHSFDKRRQWQALAKVLNTNVKDLEGRLDNPKRRFVYLRRQVSSSLADYVSKLDIPGIYLKPESRRFYPTGEISAHLVGFVNIDDHGQEGIERSYDKWLTGKPGERLVRQDRLRRTIEDLSIIKQQQPGHSIELSLDQRIQTLAYRELKREVEATKATSGSVVVIDIRTGEVLAMANSPSFNPNDRSQLQSYRYRNRAVTDAYEPGSTMKPFIMLTALEKGVANKSTIIDNRPGYIRIGHHIVRDDEVLGPMNLTTILEKSSNIGAATLAIRSGVDSVMHTFYTVGFGNVLGTGLDGESTGIVPQRRRWSDFELATMAFGYGLTVTPLQLAHAYSILGSGGIDRPVSLLKLDKAPKGQRVFDRQHTEMVLKMLQSVVSDKGTAPKARVAGYQVAGKTGTSRKANAGGYSDNYVALFAGVAPVSNPRLAIAVVINNPQGDRYYGGQIAAPVFSKVMSGSLQYLNVPPDGQGIRLVALDDGSKLQDKNDEG
ncbi:peptidoglycan D,D-transpeptidase FtsI family protein [Celerinatantimonas sp. MCCC 1A17872]|uniref:peptidoglycan D,D-transpeptidase FtsI family protein n=1 Tax=Celerinatantimonas sp. MCCC 1A17872 TaxID=3177514 RepID=UPI0038C27E3C